MKKVFLPLMAVAFILSVSSCAKCVTCKKGDEWQKLCDKDSDKEDVDDAIEYFEALGWDCKASSQSY